MNETEFVWMLVIIVCLALIGLAVLLNKMIGWLDRHFLRPKVQPKKSTLKALEAIAKKIIKLDLEGRLWVLQLVMGNCDVYLRISKDGIFINAAGSIVEDDTPASSLRKYTG